MLACFSGEGGIRTLERGCPRYSLSRRVPSATRPPLPNDIRFYAGMAILALAVLIAVLAAAIQLVLPRLVERKAVQRLTENGGHARVHLRAFPATRLLRGRGDSLVVKASGLVATRGEGGNGNGGGLRQLDGFTRVDIQVIGVRLGPLTISRLHL